VTKIVLMYFDRLFNRDGYILVTKHLTEAELILFNYSVHLLKIF